MTFLQDDMIFVIISITIIVLIYALFLRKKATGPSGKFTLLWIFGIFPIALPYILNLIFSDTSEIRGAILSRTYNEILVISYGILALYSISRVIGYLLDILISKRIIQHKNK